MVKVGDRVKVTTRRHGDYQYGDVGTVYQISGAQYPRVLSIRVRFDPGCHAATNSYSLDDLEVIVDGESDIRAYIQQELGNDRN